MEMTTPVITRRAAPSDSKRVEMEMTTPVINSRSVSNLRTGACSFSVGDSNKWNKTKESSIAALKNASWKDASWFHSVPMHRVEPFSQ